MLKLEQIPDECWVAAMKVPAHEGLRAAIAAAINAWPGAQDSGITYGKASTRIYILPLPQEGE